jgi:hypothetical protein
MLKNLFIISFIFFITDSYSTPLRKSHSSDSLWISHKKFAAYSPGLYAPVGFIAGNCNKKGHGIYVAGRFNFNIFKKAEFHFEGSAVDDRSLNWYYTGQKKYSRWEIAIGSIINLYTLKKRFHFKLLAGAGIQKPRYLYSFSNSSKFGNSNYWVEYKELGKMNFNPELSFLFSVEEDVNFHIGMSTIHKKHERMLFFGIGFKLRSNKK